MIQGEIISTMLYLHVLLVSSKNWLNFDRAPVENSAVVRFLAVLVGENSFGFSFKIYILFEILIK